MEDQEQKVQSPKRICLATASLIFGALVWVFGAIACFSGDVLPDLVAPLAFFCAFGCSGLSFAYGITSLDKIKCGNAAPRGKTQAIAGMACSAAGLIALGGLFVWMIYAGLRGEPYDQSQPVSVKANLENNFGFKFPENMQAFKGAHGLGPGVHPKANVCIVRFTTDPNGFAQLQDSLSESDDYTERLPFQNYDPRNYSRTKAPVWYKGKITEGIVYKAGVWCSAGLLLVVAVESEQGDKIDVYMEATGGDRLRVEQEETD